MTVTMTFDRSYPNGTQVVPPVGIATCTYQPLSPPQVVQTASAVTTCNAVPAQPQHGLAAKIAGLFHQPPTLATPCDRGVWQVCEEDPWWRAQRLHIVRSIVSDPRELDDLCQEVSLYLGQVLRRHPSLGLGAGEITGQFVRRLSRVTRDSCIMYARRRASDQRLNPVSLTVDELENVAAPPSDTMSLDEQQKTLQALSELPDDERRCLLLFAEGKNCRAIARHRNLSVYQVQRLITKARHELRRRLKDLEPPGC